MVVLSSLRASNGVLRASTRRRCLPFFCIRSRALSVTRTNSINDDGVLPFLIVGAGPVGLILSMLITKLGVDCAILENNTTFSNHPQAHFINNRSMEVVAGALLRITTTVGVHLVSLVLNRLD